MFKSIEDNVTTEITEKKSKFICDLYVVESVEQAEKYIERVRQKYFDAKHHCFAYSVMQENRKVDRFSDDGEPSGTAGSPMLNVLNSQNLSNILVIVTRYFGGVLLGTGGLVKAYTGALIKALDKSKIVSKELGNEVEFLVGYSDLEKLKYYFKQKNIRILHTEYAENVNIIAEMKQDDFENMLKQKESLKFKILKSEVLKEKFIVVCT